MLVETCIRKGLGLKAHRVVAVREEGEVIVAEIVRLGRRRLRCSGCGGESCRTAGRQGVRRWRDLRLRDRPLVLIWKWSDLIRQCAKRSSVSLPAMSGGSEGGSRG